VPIYILRSVLFAAFCASIALGSCSSPGKTGHGTAGSPGGAPFVSHAADRSEPVFAGQPPEATPAEPVELIVLPEADESLLPMAAPLAARLRHARGVPVLLALSDTPTDEVAGVIKRLAPGGCIALSFSPDRLSSWGIEERTAETLLTISQPTDAGIHLAKRFWGKSERVVAAPMDDPIAVILGSALSAHLAVPFIPVRDDRDGQILSEALAELGAGRIFVVIADAKAATSRVGTAETGAPASRSGTLPPSWAESLGDRAEVVDASAVQRLVIQKIGAKNVQNVILARVPRGPPAVGSMSWLAPYLSLIRGAPVVLCDSPDGSEAEEKVAALLGENRLKPRSVTILADYDSIGVITVRDEAVLGEYEVEIEPCSGPAKGKAAAFGVGRITGSSLEEASVLIARNLVRERLMAETPTRVLLIANPKTVYAALPFCETVSRATAEEFKNFGITIDEFYGKESGDPAILEAAGKADLVIYQGHITDLQLFENPFSFPEPEEGLSPPWGSGWQENRTLAPLVFPAEGEVDNDYGHDSLDADPADSEVEPADTYHGIAQPTAPEPEEFTPDESSQHAAPRKRVQLERLPLLVFQSCHSLEEWLAKESFRSGSIGVMGSVTNVHSASGSAFIKAFCDGMLYRGDTVGEALRDARNYFLCLAELKGKRGHKEKAKVYRVALSFRLWGDPEARIPITPPGMRDLPPVTARLDAGNGVHILVPARRLPECRTEKYSVHIFPGSQLAGIVMPLKDNLSRELIPIYFFRVPMPEGFTARGYAGIQRHGDMTPRAAFLSDPLERFLYVVYFPEKAKGPEQFLLHFGK